MNSEVERSCGCEPCLVDLDTYGFRTEWEDPFFVGKQCLWHKHIKGKRGCISPDVKSGRPAIYVQFARSRFSVSRQSLSDWFSGDVIELVDIGKSTDWKRAKVFYVTLKDDQFTVPVSELRRWAKRVGGKRK